MEKCDRKTANSIDVIIDFTRPDGQRTRPLLVDGKRLYVDEHYISVWSPVLRYVFWNTQSMEQGKDFVQIILMKTNISIS